ncbi:hypothetical protein I551_3702 [Mycobacterium ulcerans str. Harvey]|uniref:Uncharacterized protein n=2 Tax=Mycobacterium ulcerans TaxID=1809 RepID=A0PQJ2_MYCUA|nr:conserved hypothetical protein [Mycobacterium ulcerans Agy99]EUA89821.1 hypothetical protein I551_3702 [Mycobacterium ulcerans str. Harvey]OIN34954.1 hypothetical protein A3649_10265 [Mycobacterium ulcerans]
MRIGSRDSGLVYLDGDQWPLGRHEGRSGAAVAWLNPRTPQPTAKSCPRGSPNRLGNPLLTSTNS